MKFTLKNKKKKKQSGGRRKKKIKIGKGVLPQGAPIRPILIIPKQGNLPKLFQEIWCAHETTAH